MPETWDAQVKAGLVRPWDGIRFNESIELEDDHKFNDLAAEGGKLFEIISSRGTPFYIDRLQGGCYIEDYPYDADLVKKYEDVLGENFWGFQMHEWMSNYSSDLKKLNGVEDWTEEKIKAAIFKKYPYTHLFLESMNLKEMTENGRPESFEEYSENTERLLEDRMKRTHGRLVTCDSYYLAFPLEARNGVGRMMAEVGAQTRDTRFQLSFLRGIARSSGTHFGAYYEPWGGRPFSACCYQRDGLNEWNETNDSFPYATAGGNGGSSRSLQRRIHLYAYMAGAEFISEEWGMCNTFYDWKDFELTPYGEVKRDFLRFTEKYPDVSELMTPVCVVLPAELDFVENIYTDSNAIAGFIPKGTLADKMTGIRKTLRAIFTESDEMQGDETEVLRNCKAFDAVDVTTADFFDAGKYDFIVDLTYDADFAERYKDRIITADMVGEAIEKSMPVSCKGSALKMLAKCGGGYYLMLLNNSGVIRSVADGEQYIAEEEKTVTVVPKGGLKLSKLEGNGEMKTSRDGFEVVIPVGGWFFGKLDG